MKYLAFFLFPILVFAQSTNYPDKITTIDNREYPCLIQEFDNIGVNFIYKESEKSDRTGYDGIKEIFLEANGIVYTDSTKFMKDKKLLNQFLKSRNNLTSKNIEENNEPDNKYFFEIHYIPNQYSYYYISYYSSLVYNVKGDFSIFEAEFGQKFSDNANFKLSLGISSDFEKNRYEYSGSSSDHVYTESMTIISVMGLFECKLFPQSLKKVSPYLIMGAGKDFANYYNKTDNYDDDDDSDTDKDYNKYISKLNSPLRGRIGFGAEYQLNNYLSITSSIRIDYTKITTTQKDDDETRDITYSNLDTNVGIGLRFYF